MTSNVAGTRNWRQRHGAKLAWRRPLPHVFLLTYCLVAVLPIALVVINSFKSQRNIFDSPLGLPSISEATLEGYETLLDRGSFPTYFFNSMVVSLVSIVLILVFGTFVSYLLGVHRFRGDRVLTLFFAAGLMIPIRLATISILRLTTWLGLVDSIWALVPVYIAQGLPIAVLILHPYYQSLDRSILEAARIDGASEYRVIGITAPIVRPALAAVAVFVMIPIWNDLWFPLILASNEESKTVILGVQQFFGQFETNWTTVLAALTLSMLPILLLFLALSRWMIAGLTDGATKG